MFSVLCKLSDYSVLYFIITNTLILFIDWSDMMTNESQKQSPSPEPLFKMIIGGFVQQAISVVSKLGIPDLLKEDPKTIEELASRTNSHTPTLYRLMCALSSIGLFQEVDKAWFEITPLGTYLQKDVEGSVRGMAIMVGEKWHRNAWDNLLYSVQTGETAFHKVHSKNIFDYMSEHPEAGEVFNNAMSDLSKLIEPVLDYYDFTNFNRVIDVGGGHGSLMEGILNRSPNIKGTVYDLPFVIEGTKKYIQNIGLENRCECLPGNFFDSVPSDGDAYVLKSIIHDWHDDEAISILQNCRKGILENGKLILIEAVIEPGNHPHLMKFFDLDMIILAKGKERTQIEFKELLEKSGFKLTKIIPTPTVLSIIEAMPS